MPSHTAAEKKKNRAKAVKARKLVRRGAKKVAQFVRKVRKSIGGKRAGKKKPIVKKKKLIFRKGLSADAEKRRKEKARKRLQAII